MRQFHVSEKKTNVSIPSLRTDYTEKTPGNANSVFFPQPQLLA